jgi:hypothetical protein
MEGPIKESDWKLFSRLSETALDRYCARVLSELTAVAADNSKTNHERYGAIYGLIHDRNKELAHAFDGTSRSKALLQLANICRLGPLTDEEMSRFSPETRQIIRGWLAINSSEPQSL